MKHRLVGLKLERVDLFVDVGTLHDSSWNETGVCFPNSWGFKGRDAGRNVEEKKITLPASLYEGNPPGHRVSVLRTYRDRGSVDVES